MDMEEETFAEHMGINLSDLEMLNLSLQGNESSITDGDQDKYEKAMLNYYLMGIGGTSVCFVGILCNILSLIVLRQKYMNSSTYTYLRALSVCDLLALVVVVTIFLLSSDIKMPKKGQITWDGPLFGKLFPYLHPLATTFQVLSIWLTLAFTVDRYIMICHPMKSFRWCSVTRAKQVVAGLCVLGFVFSIPRFLEYKTQAIVMPVFTSIKNTSTGELIDVTTEVETRYMVQYTDMGRDRLFIDLVHSYCYFVFNCGIPFLTLLILNTCLFRAVQNSRRKGRTINANDKKRNDTTIMLIGVIFIFLLCQGPALISRMVYAIDITLATKSMKFHIINETGNFLIIVNSAINIVPYFLFGKRFRERFERLFCKCCLSKQKLRQMTRNFSFSVDHRRISHCSNNSQYELNGFQQHDTYKTQHHRDSNSPLLQHLEKPHRDSVQTLDTQVIDRYSPCSLDRYKRESPTPLRVVWEMDDNKNEKCNIKLECLNLQCSQVQSDD